MSDFNSQVKADLLRSSIVPFVIFSVDKADLSPEVNRERQNFVERQLAARNLPFKKVQGVYKGVRETAYKVSLYGQGVEDWILLLARRYGQESVLQVDFNRFAMLLFLHQGNGGPNVKTFKGVGYWREITADEAANEDNFTQDGDRYYSTRQFA